MDQQPRQNEYFMMKPVIMAFCYFASIGLLRTVVSELLAFPLVTLLIGLVFYWIPPRPRVSYTRWCLRYVYIATAVFMFFTVYIVVKKHIVG